MSKSNFAAAVTIFTPLHNPVVVPKAMFSHHDSLWWFGYNSLIWIWQKLWLKSVQRQVAALNHSLLGLSSANSSQWTGPFKSFCDAGDFYIILMQLNDKYYTGPEINFPKFKEIAP